MKGKLSTKIVLTLLFCGAVTSRSVKRDLKPKVNYEGYKLLRTEVIPDEETAKTLMSMDTTEGVYFWEYPAVHRSADIFVSPEMTNMVESMLQKLDVKHATVVDNMQKLLDVENPPLNNTFGPRQATGMTWTRYHRYADIVRFATSLRSSSEARVTVESIGKSSEGRDIIMIKIASLDSSANKPAIFIDGGMHAREWISPATVTYIADKLARNNGAYKHLLNMFDFYIVPVINVDGYEYTHTNDRFWRKTRSRNGGVGTSGSCKQGVDPNRNWGFKWGQAGTSRDPCSDIYPGPRPFSEPETTALSNKIMQLKNQIKVYITMHSYSQMWLLPYGYANGARPADYNELHSVASQGKAALEGTYGTRYRMGTAPDLLYPASGGSDDWAKGVAGIKYSYTLELRDTGAYGFALPASQILPTAEETFRGVQAVAKTVGTKLKLQG